MKWHFLLISRGSGEKLPISTNCIRLITYYEFYVFFKLAIAFFGKDELYSFDDIVEIKFPIIFFVCGAMIHLYDMHTSDDVIEIEFSVFFRLDIASFGENARLYELHSFGDIVKMEF